MKRSNRTRQFSLLSSDHFHIDGLPYVFAGETRTGYIFFQPGANTVVELAPDELTNLMLEPGRFLLEPEFFKHGRRK